MNRLNLNQSINQSSDAAIAVNSSGVLIARCNKRLLHLVIGIFLMLGLVLPQVASAVTTYTYNPVGYNREVGSDFTLPSSLSFSFTTVTPIADMLFGDITSFVISLIAKDGASTGEVSYTDTDITLTFDMAISGNVPTAWNLRVASGSNFLDIDTGDAIPEVGVHALNTEFAECNTATNNNCTGSGTWTITTTPVSPPALVYIALFVVLSALLSRRSRTKA